MVQPNDTLSKQALLGQFSGRPQDLIPEFRPWESLHGFIGQTAGRMIKEGLDIKNIAVCAPKLVPHHFFAQFCV